jgi:hypothetical protein
MKEEPHEVACQSKKLHSPETYLGFQGQAVARHMSAGQAEGSSHSQRWRTADAREICWDFWGPE